MSLSLGIHHSAMLDRAGRVLNAPALPKALKVPVSSLTPLPAPIAHARKLVPHATFLSSLIAFAAAISRPFEWCPYTLSTVAMVSPKIAATCSIGTPS